MKDIEKFISEQKVVTPFDIREEFDDLSTCFEDSVPIGVEAGISTHYMGLSMEFSEKVMYNENIVKIIYSGREAFLYMFLCHKNYFDEQIGEPENPNRMLEARNDKSDIFEVREYRDIEFFSKMKEKERVLDEKPYFQPPGVTRVLAGMKEKRDAMDYLNSIGHDIITGIGKNGRPKYNEKPESK